MWSKIKECRRTKKVKVFLQSSHHERRITKGSEKVYQVICEKVEQCHVYVKPPRFWTVLKYKRHYETIITCRAVPESFWMESKSLRCDLQVKKSKSFALITPQWTTLHWMFVNRNGAFEGLVAWSQSKRLFVSNNSMRSLHSEGINMFTSEKSRRVSCCLVGTMSSCLYITALRLFFFSFTSLLISASL